ncbi:MAG: MinD/ParA family ATP-binding protein, partial [Steroidobacteraceae bacterium]
PGLNASVLDFCQAAQQQLIVLRNEPASLTDAYALMKVLSRDRHVNSFRVLVNMARNGAEAHNLFMRLQRVTDRYLDVALDYAGEIPDDSDVPQAVRAQRSVLAAYPTGPAARAYQRFARDVQRWPAPSQPSGRLEFFFERLLTRPPARLQVIK